MNQSELIEKVKIALSNDPNLQGLFLAGSYGRGDADRYSDLDFVAVLEPDHFTAFVQRWREALSEMATFVYWQQSGSQALLVNSTTDTWLRIDLFVTTPEHFQARTQDSVQPLIDNQQLYASLSPSAPRILPSRGRVKYAITEFIRVFGLLHVGIGRKEYYISSVGTSLLKDQLVTVMQEGQSERYFRRGMLSFSKGMTPENMAILASLPNPSLDPDDIISAQLAIARIFFPLARKLAAELDIEWPTAFEAATKAMLQREFGSNYAVNWP